MKDLVKEITLSNGLTVWISPDDSDSKIYGSVIVKAGAKDSPNTGIAHYFEHIMFKGTQNIGTLDYSKEAPLLRQISEQYELLKAAEGMEEKDKIQMEINRLSIEAAKYAIPNDYNNLISKYGGSNLNAGTSYDYTLFYNSFSPEYMEQWCELNSERLVDPIFRLFQSELETVYEEKNRYADNMGSLAMERIFERVAAPHPYRYPIIGSTEALKSPDLVAMRAFFDTFYFAENMCLILVGDVKVDDLEPLLERTFGRIKSGQISMPKYPTPKPFAGHERMDIRLPIPFVKGCGYIWHTVPNNHPDQLVLIIIQSLLSNSGKTGLLDRLTIDERITEAAAFNMSLNDMGVFGFYVVPKLLQSTYLAKKKVLDAIGTIKSGAIDEEMIEEVKRALYRSYILQIESSEKRSKMLSNLFAQSQDWDDLMNDLDRLQSVKCEEVVKVANRYLGDNFLEVKKRTGHYPKDKIARPPYLPLEAPNSGEKSPFALYLESINVPTRPIKMLDFDKDCEQIYLSQDHLVQLFCVPNKVNDLFTLELLIFRQPYQHPIQGLSADYLDLVGGNGMSAHEINRHLQRLGATVNYESRESFFVITITGFDDYFDETIGFVGAFLQNIQVDKKPMRKIVEGKRIADKAVASDLPILSNRLFDVARYGERAPFKTEPTLTQTKRIKASAVVAEIQQLFSTEMDIHYTGTKKLNEVAPVVKRSLDLNDVTRQGEGYFYQESISYDRDTLFFLRDQKASQVLINGYLPIGNLSEYEKTVLRVLSAYLGGGMSSLLFQEIREYRSLAYSVSGLTNIPPHTITNGVAEFMINLGTQPDKVLEAVFLLQKLLYQKLDNQARFEAAIEGMMSSLRGFYPALRMKSRTISSYIRQGYDRDFTQILVEELGKIKLDDMVQLHQQRVLETPLTLTLAGNINNEIMQKLSETFQVIEVSTKELLK